MESRDIIISLALEYDLPTLLNYCRTSKRINDLVCNNNLFWILKLKKDFDISFADANTELSSKDYYKEIVEEIREYPNINELYSNAVSYNNRLDLVKIALDRGADINYHFDTINTPLVRAFFLGLNEIFDYLLERGAVNSKDGAVLNIKYFLKLFESSSVKDQIRIISTLFEKIFPKIYKLPSFKKFWKGALAMLERNRNFIPEIYDRRINEIRALAENT